MFLLGLTAIFFLFSFPCSNFLDTNVEAVGELHYSHSKNKRSCSNSIFINMEFMPEWVIKLDCFEKCRLIIIWAKPKPTSWSSSSPVYWGTRCPKLYCKLKHHISFFFSQNRIRITFVLVCCGVDGIFQAISQFCNKNRLHLPSTWIHHGEWLLSFLNLQ